MAVLGEVLAFGDKIRRKSLRNKGISEKKKTLKCWTVER